MRRARLRSIALVGVVGVALAGCGDTAITATASEELEDLVVRSRQAAVAGETGSAAQFLDELREHAGALAADGHLSESRLEEIVAAADEVEARLDLAEVPEPTEAPADEGDGQVEPDADDRDEDRDKDRDKDKEKDEDDDDDDDEGDEDDDEPGRGRGRGRGGD